MHQRKKARRFAEDGCVGLDSRASVFATHQQECLVHTFEIVVHRGPIEGEYVLEGQSQLYVAKTEH